MQQQQNQALTTVANTNSYAEYDLSSKTSANHSDKQPHNRQNIQEKQQEKGKAQTSRDERFELTERDDEEDDEEQAHA